MIFTLSVGDAIPLSLQLVDYDPAKFVKVFLRDETTTQIAGSPVQLAPIGSLGLYADNNISMPDNPFVTAQYVVYDDAGYSIVSTSEGGTSDTFVQSGFEVGGLLPVFTQLFDYNPNLFPQAFLTDQNGDPIGSAIPLSPIGSLGFYGDLTTEVPDTNFAIAQYVVYSDSGHSTVSTSQGGNSDTFNIGSAGMLLLSLMPQVGDTLLDYFQPMQFTQIVKSVSQFQSKEQGIRHNFQGVWQPFSAQQLRMKPIGQRAWNWQMLHADPSLALKPDDTVKYLTRQYRVMSKWDYTNMGYIQYDLVLDWTGSGPG